MHTNPEKQFPSNHIFEPRYQVMVKRCLAADSVFGVCLITEGEEGESDTFPSLVGTTARITESQPFADGRMNIQTVGERRFQIVSLREQDDYLVGTVEWLDDVETSDAALEWAQRVRDSLKRYLELMAANTQVSGIDLTEVPIPNDPETLSMAVGSLLQITNDQKQELLEMTTTVGRLSELHALLRRSEVNPLSPDLRAVF